MRFLVDFYSDFSFQRRIFYTEKEYFHCFWLIAGATVRAAPDKTAESGAERQSEKRQKLTVNDPADSFYIDTAVRSVHCDD